MSITTYISRSSKQGIFKDAKQIKKENEMQYNTTQ